MDQSPSHSQLETAAATLRGIWAAMLRQFGMFGVEPARQMATSRWCSAIFRRIDLLLKRYQAGKLQRVTTKRAVTPGRKVVNKAAVRMPRKFAWLVVTGKHHAACYGTQLQTVLERPEMAELLENYPQARRILRPLCRALAVQMPWVIDQPRAERPRKSRPKPEPFRHPLPRGVLTWARRDKALEQAITLKHELVLKMAQRRVR